MYINVPVLPHTDLYISHTWAVAAAIERTTRHASSDAFLCFSFWTPPPPRSLADSQQSTLKTVSIALSQVPLRELLCSKTVYSSPRTPYGFPVFLLYILYIYIFAHSCSQIKTRYPNLNLTTPPLAPFWIVAISSTRMHLFLTLYSLAEIRSGLSPTCGRDGLSDRGHSGGWWGSWYWDTVYCCDCGHTQPQRGGTFARQAMERHGEGRLFCTPQWPLHCREGKALAAHNGSF